MASLITGNKFDPNTDVPNLSGKVYIVTGGSAGIGYGIIAHLLQHNPSKIYLLSAKQDHATEAQEDLKEWGDTSKVEWRQCDLESFAQTASVAQSLAQDLSRLDALICNAGLGIGVYNETQDGLDSHMQVNHFAQAHLALTLLPLLQKTPNSRLVFQSSENHRFSPSSVKFASIEEMNEDIGPSNLYSRTKLAQILFVRQLVKRYPQTPPFVIATHPGAVSTDQPKQAEDAYGTLGTIGVAMIRPFMNDPVKQGCRSALFAATSEDVVEDKLHGKYIIPDRKVTEPTDQAKDEGLAQSLWDLTREVLKSKVGELGYEM